MHNELVWSRIVQPDCVTSDIGARLRSDSFNRGGYIVSWDKTWVEKSSFSHQNSNNYSDFFPMFSSWFWIKIEIEEWGNRSQRQSSAEMYKFRKPEVQKSRKPVVMSCHVRHCILRQCVIFRHIRHCEWAGFRASAKTGAGAEKMFYNIEKLYFSDV